MFRGVSKLNWFDPTFAREVIGSVEDVEDGISCDGAAKRDGFEACNERQAGHERCQQKLWGDCAGKYH